MPAARLPPGLYERLLSLAVDRDNVYELIEYATNILTLSPGDIISGGSPAGTNIERAEPRWMMKAGDTATCAIEGIGTLTHPIVSE